jgi:glycosyltransferase involved in cell wall biosynthesis
VVDGECGALVPPGDVAELGRALERYAADPALRRAHGAAARRRAVAEFGTPRMVERYEAVYRDVAGGSRRS